MLPKVVPMQCSLLSNDHNEDIKDESLEIWTSAHVVSTYVDLIIREIGLSLDMKMDKKRTCVKK